MMTVNKTIVLQQQNQQTKVAVIYLEIYKQNNRLELYILYLFKIYSFV